VTKAVVLTRSVRSIKCSLNSRKVATVDQAGASNRLSDLLDKARRRTLLTESRLSAFDQTPNELSGDFPLSALTRP